MVPDAPRSTFGKRRSAVSCASSETTVVSPPSGAAAAAMTVSEPPSTMLRAAASAPLGGETTLIALDAALTGLRRFPNVDLPASGTMRPELLVGDAGADKIAQARAEALAS